MSNWRLIGIVLAAGVLTAGLGNSLPSKSADIMIEKGADQRCWTACTASPSQFGNFLDGAFIQVLDSDEVRRMIDQLKRIIQEKKKSAGLHVNFSCSFPDDAVKCYSANQSRPTVTSCSADEIASSWYEAGRSPAYVRDALTVLNMSTESKYVHYEENSPEISECGIGRAELADRATTINCTGYEQRCGYGLDQFAAVPTLETKADWMQVTESGELDKLLHENVIELDYGQAGRQLGHPRRPRQWCRTHLSV